MSAISSYFVDTFKLMTKDHDKWNEVDAITETTTPCYIKWGTRMVKDINGSDVLAKAVIFCADDADVSYDDRIKIGTVEYSIIQIDHKMAFNDPHLEITIQ
jgi:hypothetical protein